MALGHALLAAGRDSNARGGREETREKGVRFSPPGVIAGKFGSPAKEGPAGPR